MHRSLERNLTLYRWYLLFSFTPFAVPIIVLFWQANGLNTFDIYLLQAIFSIAVVALEVPTGMIADRLGKRISLILGSVICAVSWLFYAASSSFASFVAAEISIALGLAFMSGADSAILYDTLSKLGRQGEFRAREGGARSLQMVAFGACMLPAGFLAAIAPRAALALSALGPFVSLFAAWKMTEAGTPRRHASPSEAFASFVSLMRAALKFVAKHRLVRWYILFGAVPIASNRWLLWLYQPYMEKAGFPIWGFGLAFALFNFFAAGTSRIAGRALERLGAGGLLVLLAGLCVAPFLLMGLIVLPMSWLFILGHQAIVVRAASGLRRHGAARGLGRGAGVDLGVAALPGGAGVGAAGGAVLRLRADSGEVFPAEGGGGLRMDLLTLAGPVQWLFLAHVAGARDHALARLRLRRGDGGDPRVLALSVPGRGLHAHRPRPRSFRAEKEGANRAVPVGLAARAPGPSDPAERDDPGRRGKGWKPAPRPVPGPAAPQRRRLPSVLARRPRAKDALVARAHERNGNGMHRDDHGLSRDRRSEALSGSRLGEVARGLDRAGRVSGDAARLLEGQVREGVQGAGLGDAGPR